MHGIYPGCYLPAVHSVYTCPLLVALTGIIVLFKGSGLTLDCIEGGVPMPQSPSTEHRLW